MGLMRPTILGETLGLELRLGTRSRAAARALVSQPPSDASPSDPPTDVTPSEVPAPDAASDSSARP